MIICTVIAAALGALFFPKPRTETILDAEGNPQTRTTYITIQDNKVTTKTTTELTITREKEKQEGNERVDFEVILPV